jgi:hypothetical protein
MTKNIYNKHEKNFLDFKAATYKNKNNGQISIVLPMKELKKFIDTNEKINVPKTIPIRIFKWRNK